MLVVAKHGGIDGAGGDVTYDKDDVESETLSHCIKIASCEPLICASPCRLCHMSQISDVEDFRLVDHVLQESIIT